MDDAVVGDDGEMRGWWRRRTRREEEEEAQAQIKPFRAFFPHWQAREEEMWVI